MKLFYVAVAVVLGAGCVGQPAPPGPRASPRTLADAFLHVETSEVLGLDDFTAVDRPRYALLDEAVDLLTADCMRQRGLPYVAEFAAAQRKARESGIRAAAREPAAETRTNDDEVRGLGAYGRTEWYAALLGDMSDTIDMDFPDGSTGGVPVAGCVSEARQSVFQDLGDWLAYEYIYDSLNGERFREYVREDVRQGDVIDARRRCPVGTGSPVRAEAHASVARPYFPESISEAATPSPQDVVAEVFTTCRERVDAHGEDAARRRRVRLRTAVEQDFEMSLAAAFQRQALRRAEIYTGISAEADELDRARRLP